MKKSGKNSKKNNQKKSSVSIRKKIFLAILLLAAGGIIFNIDRLTGTEIEWRRYYNLLPYSIRKYLPLAEPQEGRTVQGQRLTGRVESVYDGDTLTLLSSDGTTKYKIRFYGIDAPERQQEYGQEARDYLAALVSNAEVEVEVVSVDRYGRSVGKVFVNGTNVNEAMVLNGCAWYYEEYAKNEPVLADNHYSAMKNRRGLWAASDPQPPWEYRSSK